MSIRSLLSAMALSPLAWVGLGLLVLLGATALAAPWLSPYEPLDTFTPLLGPSAAHPLGCNDMGYDLWTELLHGARHSLVLGFTAAVLSCLLGLLIGALGGSLGAAGPLLMRLVDVFLAVPRFPLIILMAAFIRPGFGSLLLFFTLFGWPTVARIAYAGLRAERQAEHIAAARALGVPEGRILIRHLLPSALPVTFARLVSEMEHVIMAEAGLSFLGLGDPTMRSWGMTLAHANRYPALLLTDAWKWWALPPGLAITAVCLALVLLGLALDPLTNPRLR